MNEIQDRKNNLLTVRISDDDLETLNDLIENTSKSKSDTITRALKFWTNLHKIMGVEEDENEEWGKVRKKHKVHVRVTDSDLEALNDSSERTGLSIGQIVRRAIREYHNSSKERY